MFKKLLHFLKSGEGRSNRVKKQIFYSFGIKGLSIVIGIIYIPILLKYLDSERYGIWLTLTSIIQWISYFDLGLGNGLRNNLASSLAVKDYNTSKNLISTTYALLTIIFGIIIVCILLIFPLLHWNKILNTSIVPENELLLVALIAAIMICIQFILNIIKVVLLADQKPALSNLLDPLTQIFTLGLVVSLFKFTNIRSLITLCIIITTSTVLVLLTATIILYSKKYKIFKPSLSNIDFKLTRNILGLGQRFFVIQISGLLLYSTSNIIIIQTCGPSDVTIYQIAYRYFTICVFVFSIVMTPFWSAVTEAYTLGDFIWLKTILRKLKKLSWFFSFIVIIMLFLNPFVLRLWVGDTISIPWYLALTFSIYIILTLILTPFSSFINGLGRLKLSTYVTVVKSIIFIPIAIIATNVLGVTGIVLTLCFIQIIGLIMEPRQVKLILEKKATGIWNS